MFYKEKGFYISLLCGVVALVAFAVICMNLAGNNTEEGDLVAEETKPPVQTQIPETKETSTKEVESEVKEVEPTEAPTPKSTEKAVETNTKPVKNILSFDQETGLLWPVKGEVLMEYSADKVVYFKTLAQYRTNPALLISAKEGADVKASADGIVKEIMTSEETGRTITMEIGNNFTVTYGQLKEITVAKGDTVSEGQVIGQVAAPTKYYSMEGTNLYYQVKENKETVNPMVLLR